MNVYRISFLETFKITKGFPWHRNLIPIIRRSIGLIFLFSGIVKLTDIRAFSIKIMEFSYLPESISTILAILFSLLEISSGIFMVIGLFTNIASVIASILLIIFTAGTLPQILVGNDTECGCFGFLGSSKIDIVLLIRNATLLFLTLVIVIHSHNKKQKESTLWKIHQKKSNGPR